MSNYWPRRALWRWAGGFAIGFMLLMSGSAQAAPSDFGLEAISAAEATTQAGAHPDVFIGFALKTDPSSPEDPPGVHNPYARLRDATFELPPGLIGNPNAVPPCTNAQFASFTVGGPGCPQDTQVGITRLVVYNIQQQ